MLHQVIIHRCHKSIAVDLSIIWVENTPYCIDVYFRIKLFYPAGV